MHQLMRIGSFNCNFEERIRSFFSIKTVPEHLKEILMVKNPVETINVILTFLSVSLKGISVD